MYGEQDFTPKGVSLTISLALVGTIVVMCVLIPFIMDGAAYEYDTEVTEGGTWSYTPQTNIPATITVTCNHPEYMDWDGTTISITAPNGYYTLNIVATSENPYQTDSQSITLRFGHNDWDDIFPLLAVLPIMLIIGIILFVLRRTAGVGMLGGSNDPYDYDNY